VSGGEEGDEDFNGQNDPQPIPPEVQEKLDELSQLSEKELGERARRRQLLDLLMKLELGQLSHQEHAVLRNLLRDNGFNVFSPPGLNQPQADPRGTPAAPAPQPLPLPDLDDPEYDL
jgi:hypothetical protein